MAQDFVYGARVESFHAAVQRAPTGVGSSAGGAEAAAGPDAAGSAADEAAATGSEDAKAVVARNGRIARSFIVRILQRLCCLKE